MQIKNEKFVFKPILQIGDRLMNNKIVVKKILSQTEFLVFHEELKIYLELRETRYDEKLESWIQLPPHSNIVSILDTFTHQKGEKRYNFSLQDTILDLRQPEAKRSCTMYKHIESLNLNLGINISRQYMETIYNCIIQVCQGIDFAHSHGLVHGSLGLHNILVTYDEQCAIFKVTNFTHDSSLHLPETNEAKFWTFIKGRRKKQKDIDIEIKKRMREEEKNLDEEERASYDQILKEIREESNREIMMLKDIYSVGICLLELMIGRYD